MGSNSGDRRLPPPIFGKHITVLSIDGGGIRGIIPSIIIEHLEQELKRLDGEDARIADYFDLIAGTSTGGLIAVMLATPGDNGQPKYTASDIKDFYYKDGPNIFSPNNSLGSWLSGWWPANLLKRGPKYDATSLHKTIEEKIGKKVTLGDTLTRILLLSFDVGVLEPMLFSTTSSSASPNGNYKLSDVCIATSAAPTYFPPHSFQGLETLNLIDGGVASNNPTMAAISWVANQVLKRNRDFEPKLEYSKLIIISIGTGSVKERRAYNATECATWSQLNWARPLIEMFSHASATMVDLQVAMLLGSLDCPNYLRIQANEKLLRDGNRDGVMFSMDNTTTENMDKLVNIGSTLLEKKISQVNKYTGLYELVENGRTNREEITEFAKILIEERKRRVDGKKK